MLGRDESQAFYQLLVAVNTKLQRVQGVGVNELRHGPDTFWTASWRWCGWLVGIHAPCYGAKVGYRLAQPAMYDLDMTPPRDIIAAWLRRRRRTRNAAQ